MNPAPSVVSSPIERIGHLVNNYRLVESLRSALSSGTHAFTLVPAVVEEIIDDRAWLDRVTRNGERYTYADDGDFRSFVTDPQPQGLGITVDEVRKYLGDSSNPIRVKFETLIERGRGGSNNPLGLGGHTGKSRDPLVNPTIGRVDKSSLDPPPTIRLRDTPEEPPRPKRDRSNEPMAGNTVGYAVRRLGRAAESEPDRYGPIYGRLMAGETSAHAAMIEAGFKPKLISIPLEPMAASRLIVRHFRGDDLTTLVRELANWAGGGA